MRRHQQPADVLEQGGDRGFLGLLEVGAARHFAADDAGAECK